MSRPRTLPVWLQRGLLVGLGLVAVYAALIPLAPGGALVAPDLLYCLVIAWVVRRPAVAPLWLVLGLGLFGDLLLSRPPGLGALGLVLAAEAMRGQVPRFRGAPFLFEWLAAVAVFAGLQAATVLVLRLSLAEAPGIGTLLRYLLVTALAYPVAVAALVWGLGLAAPAAARRPGAAMARPW